MKFYGKATMFAMGLAFGSMALGQSTPTIDGTLDGASINSNGSAVSSVYGNAIAQQTQVTSFGQPTGTNGNSGPTTSSNGGSQLDAVYGLMSSTTLYLMFTGNLQTNYNHLDLWFDTGAAGQNTLSNMSGVTMSNWSGSTLSSGFNASVGITIITDAFNHVKIDTYSSGPNNWRDTLLGDFGYGANGSLSEGIKVAVNDSNSVNSINLADTTGMEFAIPLSLLGMSSASTVKIIAAISGFGDNSLSNQFLGGLNSLGGSTYKSGNLGTLGGGSTVNLSNDGNPMFSVSPQAAPEPGAIAMMGLGLASLVTAVSRRRTR